MLINSLLLFIEETLPVFILYAYLCASRHVLTSTLNTHTQVHGYFISAIVCGLLLSIGLTHIRPWLGMSFEGVGYELCLIVVSILFAGSLLSAQSEYRSQVRTLMASLSLFWLVLPQASDFTVFMVSVAQNQSISSLFIGSNIGMTVGMSLGFGICISISYLVFVMFSNISNERPLKLAISLFLAGQLSHIVIILQQVDMLSSSLPLWNTTNLVADTSEYGQFLKVVVGYDATPTLLYMGVLVSSSLLIFTYLVWQKPNQNKLHGGLQ